MSRESQMTKQNINSRVVFWSAESPMQTAERILKQLDSSLGTCYTGDWLGRYRVWLDNHEIPAEVDGWMSPEASDQLNVMRFIEDIGNANR